MAVVETNLATNPSFETASGTVEVRRNRAINPAFRTGTAGWNTWVIGSGSSTTEVVSSGGPDNDYFRRCTIVTPGDGSGSTSASLNNDPVDIASGYVGTMSIYIRSSKAITARAVIQFYTRATSTVVGSTSGPLVTLAPNTWTRISATGTNPAAGTAARISVAWGANALLTAGDTIDIARYLSEESDTLLPYFDGSTTAQLRRNLFHYPGAENGNTSGWTASGAVATASTEQSHSGSYSYRVVTSGSGTNEGLSQNANIPSISTSGTATLETLSVWVLAPQGAELGLGCEEYVLGGSFVASRGLTTFVGTGSWQRVSVQGTKASAGNVLRSYVRTRLTPQAITFYIDDALNEASPNLGSAFDGSTPTVGGISSDWLGTPNASVSYQYDADFSYAWVDTPNNSASIQTAPGVSTVSGGATRVVFQSQRWAATGTKSTRIVPLSPTSNAAAIGAQTLVFGAGDVGKTFTIGGTLHLDAVGGTDPTTADRRQRSIYIFATGTASPAFADAPNTPGDHELRFTFTVTAAGQSVRLGGSQGQSAWWDNFFRVEVPSPSEPYTGPYFDGSTPATPVHVFAWTGAANASTSTMSTYESIDSPGGGDPKMWFGTTSRMQAVPVPSSGMQASRNFWSDTMEFENGGASISRSTGHHRSYEMEFPPQENVDLDVFADYASGLYGEGLIYFTDRMIMDQNLFPPQWAAPMLTLPNSGFPSIGRFVSSTATSANSYRQPATSVRFNTTNTMSEPLDPAHSIVLPIPPGYNLWWGWSGGTTGAGYVAMRRYNANTGASSSASYFTALSNTGSTRLGPNPVSGVDWTHVVIWLGASALGIYSEVFLTSMMAQLHPIYVSPDRNGQFIPGKGNSGCRFDGEVIPQSYIIRDAYRNKDTHLTGLSCVLRETGAWEIS